MRVFLIMAVSLCLTACGTVAGTMTGAGKDLQRAGEWLSKKTDNLGKE